MVKIEVGGDLDKQYVSVAIRFFIIFTNLMYFSCELQCIFMKKINMLLNDYVSTVL